eukprot:15685-Pyramimonas_sp.AAC.1
MGSAPAPARSSGGDAGAGPIAGGFCTTTVPFASEQTHPAPPRRERSAQHHMHWYSFIEHWALGVEPKPFVTYLTTKTLTAETTFGH